MPDESNSDDTTTFPPIPSQEKIREMERRAGYTLALQKFRNESVKFLLPENSYENVLKFYSFQPFFYDKSGTFWFWSHKECRYVMVDETDIFVMLEDVYNARGQTLAAKNKGMYLESFKRIGRQHLPPEPPKTWVQFGDTIYDTETKTQFPATAEHFICNPIPWTIGPSSATPTMDRLFKEWVGEEYVQTLYEIIAYCCLIDYPLHHFFCLLGSGRNGKSKFQALLRRFVGKENYCSTELDQLIENRFETSKLYKKLVCLMGETNFGVLNQTSILKKLVGQDTIGYEFKGKTGFTDTNYAKIIIASNSLPSSYDTSEGWYRRIIIIDFPNEFDEGKDVLDQIPESEYRNLSNKVIGILPNLLRLGKFTNQGSIEQRKQRYIEASNPLKPFLDRFCHFDAGEGFIPFEDFKTKYTAFLNARKKRIVSIKELKGALEMEGYTVTRLHRKQESGELSKYGEEYFNGYAITNLRWNDQVIGKDIKDFVQIVQIVQQFPISSLYAIGELENTAQTAQNAQNSFNILKDLPLIDQVLAQIPEHDDCNLYDVVYTFETIGCNRDIVIDIINKLKNDGRITEPRPDKLRRNHHGSTNL